jgi:prepilin-type processing-associated H-X9-DG protein
MKPVNKCALAFLSWCITSISVFAACETLDVKGQRYTDCSFERGTATIETYSLNRDGEPFRYLSSLASELQEDGKTLVFAMNAGMYDDNYLPIGFYMEDGQQAKKLNRRSGAGNFHLKPNGVFYVKDGKPAVVETEAFAKSGVKPDFASQSGPMLVINGKIHPKFSESGTSRKLRNGVGIDTEGRVHFVISDGAVTFWEFATLFRDELKTRNALFFDGSVSSIYAPEIGRSDGLIPLGPMVGVTEIK